MKLAQTFFEISLLIFELRATSNHETESTGDEDLLETEDFGDFEDEGGFEETIIFHVGFFSPGFFKIQYRYFRFFK